MVHRFMYVSLLTNIQYNQLLFPQSSFTLFFPLISDFNKFLADYSMYHLPTHNNFMFT